MLINQAPLPTRNDGRLCSVFILHDTQALKLKLELNAMEIQDMYHDKQVGPFFALLYNNWCKPSASALHQSFFRQILHQFSRRLEHRVHYVGVVVMEAFRLFCLRSSIIQGSDVSYDATCHEPHLSNVNDSSFHNIGTRGSLWHSKNFG